MRLTVIGTGYLGATHAAAMAELGHDVLGVDVDEQKIKRLASGEVPFFEPGLPELLARQIDAGRLRFTTSFDEVRAFGEVHFVCVGTPQKKGEFAADTSYVDGAFAELARGLPAGTVVVGKSTVPAGSAARLAELLTPIDAELLWNPEFLREGRAVEDTLHPDRIVIGARSSTEPAARNAVERLRAVYAEVIAAGSPVVETDFATAELVKMAANSFLATKISFINAMAEICEMTGADVMELAKALSFDQRIGGRFLHPGLGFGGGCLPKDIRAFMARCGELGIDQALTFLKEVDAINMRRRVRMVDMARELCDGSLAGRRVAVWGAAFKPDSDDIRDSPALDVALAVQKAGAAVRVYDPQAMDNARRDFPTLAYARSAALAAQDAEVILHLTEWDEFLAADPNEVATVVSQRQIVDGRNALNREQWRAAGWTYRALGRT